MNSSSNNYKNIYYPPGGILLWIIIFLELITFGVALIVMANFSNQEPEIFHTSRMQLNSTIGAVNTVFLIVSGFFMAVSVHYFKLNNVKKASFFLRITMLGGILFLILKSFEYSYKIDMGLTIGHNTFYTFYWMLTLFHVIHVIVGLVILTSVYLGINKKKMTTSIVDVEASAAFWHMCDLIWLLLFPVIYLIF